MGANWEEPLALPRHYSERASGNAEQSFLDIGEGSRAIAVTSFPISGSLNIEKLIPYL